MFTVLQEVEGNIASSDTASTGSMPDLETVSDGTWITLQPPPSTPPRRLDPNDVLSLQPRPDSPRPSLFDSPRPRLSDSPRSLFTSPRPPLLDTLRRPINSDPVQGSGHVFEQYLLFIHGQDQVSLVLWCLGNYLRFGSCGFTSTSSLKTWEEGKSIL